jgi:hypothetical protein
MDQRRLVLAVEAAAEALHEHVRRPMQPCWKEMSEAWREEMRQYLRPSVEAALKTSDMHVAGQRPRRAMPNRPRLPLIVQ